MFGSSIKDNPINDSILKNFEKDFFIEVSKGLVVNNNKISFNGNTCKINEISYPKQVCKEAISFLSAVSESRKKYYNIFIEDGLNNGPSRILLYGEPGNGKTTMGKVFSDVFKAKMIFLDSTSILKKHYGESEDEIEKYFYEVKKLLSQGERVVLLIDEIDAIAYNQDNVKSEASPKVAHKLQTCIDNINNFQNSKQLIIIATTNRKNALSGPILSRFSSKVEIKKPDNLQILSKISKLLDDEELDLNKEKILKAISKSTSFRECVLCAEQLKKMMEKSAGADEGFFEKSYSDCISDLQISYWDYAWKQIDKTASYCKRVNPILSTTSFFLSGTSSFFNIFKFSSKNSNSSSDNVANESTDE